MTHLDRQIRSAQHRLRLNRWLRHVSWFLGAAAVIFAAIVLIQRLYDVSIPLPWIAVGLGGGGLLGSIIWTITQSEDAVYAAARLDEAAGLRERLSSGHYCQDQDDLFAQAVTADAEHISRSLSARQHLRLIVPQSLVLTTMSFILAALMFLVPTGLLKTSEAVEAAEQAVKLDQTRIAVKREMSAIRRLAETTPALEDLKEKLDGLDKQTGGRLERPADIRHEAVKKIDRLADAVKQKRQSEKYQRAIEMRKMLRGLKVPKSSQAPTQKLAKALAKGDYKTAKEELKALQEQLATLKSEKDRELVAKMSKQLDDLAKQLQKLAKNEKLAQKLARAGIKKEDIDRLLENLKKKDLDQLKKQLEASGMSKQQIEKITKQLKQRQQAGTTAQKLAESMQRGAKAASAGQMSGAIAGLTMAVDQLSELEQLEQEMNQLDSLVAGLQDAREGIDRPCSYCSGQGCARCKGTGRQGGMGQLGRGRGGLAPEEQTAIGFKTERGKVHTGRGAVIGQFLFDGEQVKGEVTTSLSEVVTAAEHDASDRINRNRIPRQYHKAVKAYFSNVKESIKDAKLEQPPGATDGGSANESSDQTTDPTEKSTD